MNGKLRRRIDAGECVVGAIVGFGSETVVELAVAAGFDFVVIDTEHGAISAEAVANMIRAADSFGAEAIVRVGANERAPIQIALDAGAAGVQVPMVDTAQEAARLVQYARYAPAGTRGLAGNRASSYRAMTRDLMREANESVVLIAQIETRAGLRNASAICGVPGIDVVFVGPTDLSQSLGEYGDLDSPGVTEAIVGVAAQNLGRKRIGVLARNPATAVRFHRGGYSLFEVAASALTVAAFRQYTTGVAETVSAG